MRLVDLSHPLHIGAPRISGDRFTKQEHHGSVVPGARPAARLALGTHEGTHVDATSYYLPEGHAIEHLPLECFYGPARMLKIPKEARQDITVDDLAPFEDYLQPGSRIIISTGWHLEYGTVRFFIEYPSMTSEAAQFLAHRRLKLLGMDTPTPGREEGEVHRILMGNTVEFALVGSLANLDQMPDQFTFIGFPLNLPGSEGSPIRAVGAF
jgi:arylformamidase